MKLRKIIEDIQHKRKTSENKSYFVLILIANVVYEFVMIGHLKNHTPHMLNH